MRCQNSVYWLIQGQRSNEHLLSTELEVPWLLNFSSLQFLLALTEVTGRSWGSEWALMDLFTGGLVCLAQEEDHGRKEGGPPGEEERNHLSRGLDSGPCPSPGTGQE